VSAARARRCQGSPSASRRRRAVLYTGIACRALIARRPGKERMPPGAWKPRPPARCVASRPWKQMRPIEGAIVPGVRCSALPRSLFGCRFGSGRTEGRFDASSPACRHPGAVLEINPVAVSGYIGSGRGQA
jgi:hypothetical protein